MFRRNAQSLMTALTVETFWGPFTRGITGPDIDKYPFADAMKQVSRPNVFTSQVNGVVGGKSVVEDFFIAVLSGFDISSVDIKEFVSETASANGTYRLIHRRPFLGWVPQGDAVTADVSVDVPFYMHGEGTFHGMQLSHLTFRSSLMEALRDSKHAPPVTLELVQDMEALRMLVALRRANVKPEKITENLLRSVSKKQETWCNALGLK